MVGTMAHTEQIMTVAQWLRDHSKIVGFTGAGISTPSGIPDFRSPESGLWKNADPMAVASIYGFRQNPRAFYDWVRPLAQLTADAEPNPAHTALANLEHLGKLCAVITQNIDMLHSRAGNTTIYELHGHMREMTCIRCFHVFDAIPIMQRFLVDGRVPHCPGCNGVLKPNVILYGEQLPIEVFNQAKKAARECEVMLVIGSSLEVAPASDLPVMARRNGAKVAIINLEPTSLDNIADLVIHDDAAQVLPAIVQSLENIL